MFSAEYLGISPEKAEYLLKIFDRPGCRWGDDEPNVVWGNRVKLLFSLSPSRFLPATKGKNVKSTFQKELHLKAHGQESSAAPHQQEIERMRLAAYVVAERRGTVSMNDLREAFPEMEWGNWCGSIFSKKNFVFTGEYVKARYKGAHARDIKVWALK